MYEDGIHAKAGVPAASLLQSVKWPCKRIDRYLIKLGVFMGSAKRNGLAWDFVHMFISII
jgi:hypothetical protein